MVSNESVRFSPLMSMDSRVGHCQQIVVQSEALHSVQPDEIHMKISSDMVLVEKEILLSVLGHELDKCGQHVIMEPRSMETEQGHMVHILIILLLLVLVISDIIFLLLRNGIPLSLSFLRNSIIVMNFYRKYSDCLWQETR